MTDLSDVCRNRSFDQWFFGVFFIMHLANLRSVKIVLLMNGNPGEVSVNVRFGEG